MVNLPDWRNELINSSGVWVSTEKRIRKNADEGKSALNKEITDTKEELESVRNELSQLKENLQVELKEKEVC